MMNFFIFILSCISNAISVTCGGVLSDDQLVLAGHGIAAMFFTFLPIFFRIKRIWTQRNYDAMKEPVLYIQIACCFVIAIVYLAIIYLFFYQNK